MGSLQSSWRLSSASSLPLNVSWTPQLPDSRHGQLGVLLTPLFCIVSTFKQMSNLPPLSWSLRPQPEPPFLAREPRQPPPRSPCLHPHPIALHGAASNGPPTAQAIPYPLLSEVAPDLQCSSLSLLISLQISLWSHLPIVTDTMKFFFDLFPSLWHRAPTLEFSELWDQ